MLEEGERGIASRVRRIPKPIPTRGSPVTLCSRPKGVGVAVVGWRTGFSTLGTNLETEGLGDGVLKELSQKDSDTECERK
eukprot:1924214-Rhodomonas_salina.10